MITPIEHEDYDNMLEFVKNIKSLTRLDFDDTMLRRIHTRCILHGFAYKVLDKTGNIVGACYSMVIINHWGEPVATDLLNYSEQETPKLLRKYITWGKEMGARYINVTNSFGNERYDRLIKALGFHQSSITHMMEV